MAMPTAIPEAAGHDERGLEVAPYSVESQLMVESRVGVDISSPSPPPPPSSDRIHIA